MRPPSRARFLRPRVSAKGCRRREREARRHGGGEREGRRIERQRARSREGGKNPEDSQNHNPPHPRGKDSQDTHRQPRRHILKPPAAKREVASPDRTRALDPDWLDFAPRIQASVTETSHCRGRSKETHPEPEFHGSRRCRRRPCVHAGLKDDEGPFWETGDDTTWPRGRPFSR